MTKYNRIMVNGERMLLHRYVVETNIGRKLLKSEHVHHINGDIYDNRLENLELLTASEHQKRHYHTSNKNFKKYNESSKTTEVREKIRGTLNGVVGNMSREDLEEMYVNQCMSLREIGKKLGISKSGVGKSMKKKGINLRSVGCYVNSKVGK